tara:strand:+ start:212 stop:475 length:264 start_codon:yes stop_codon:yes gene_type:complete
MKRFKQSSIDYIVNQDYTREQLAEQLVEARYNSSKHQAEAEWLDELATHYRDNQGDEHYATVCVNLYDDYRQRIASINDRYLNKKES